MESDRSSSAKVWKEPSACLEEKKTAKVGTGMFSLVSLSFEGEPTLPSFVSDVRTSRTISKRPFI